MGEQMNGAELKPQKITKPIQLLAALLAGLVLVDGSFLGAAASLTSIPALQSALVYAAIFNVLLFVVLLFLLLTRFRAEMLEDPFYIQHAEARSLREDLNHSKNEADRLRGELKELTTQGTGTNRAGEESSNESGGANALTTILGAYEIVIGLERHGAIFYRVLRAYETLHPGSEKGRTAAELIREYHESLTRLEEVLPDAKTVFDSESARVAALARFAERFESGTEQIRLSAIEVVEEILQDLEARLGPSAVV